MKFKSVAIILVVLVLFCCRKEKVQPPVANAGPPQVLVSPQQQVRLFGTATADPGDPVVHYSWRKLNGGGNLTFHAGVNGLMIVRGLEEGVYYFELLVKTRLHATRDTVQVTVKNDMTYSKSFEQLPLNGATDCGCTIENLHSFLPATAVMKVYYRHRFKTDVSNEWRLVDSSRQENYYYEISQGKLVFRTTVVIRIGLPIQLPAIFSLSGIDSLYV